MGHKMATYSLIENSTGAEIVTGPLSVCAGVFRGFASGLNEDAVITKPSDVFPLPVGGLYGATLTPVIEKVSAPSELQKALEKEDVGTLFELEDSLVRLGAKSKELLSGKYSLKVKIQDEPQEFDIAVEFENFEEYTNIHVLYDFSIKESVASFSQDVLFRKDSTSTRFI